MSLPTVADLKPHLNMTATVDDVELQDHLDAAVDVVEGLIGPVATGSVTETHRNVSSDVLVLRSMPVAELTAVSSRVGATTTALTLADYELDAGTGIVRRVDGGGFYGSFTVTYSVGRAVLPASIRLAILIIAGHLWETQRGGGSVRPTFPGEEADIVPAAGTGYLIPHRARSLLEPYMHPTVA